MKETNVLNKFEKKKKKQLLHFGNNYTYKKLLSYNSLFSTM